jgi:hypothetical protein
MLDKARNMMVVRSIPIDAVKCEACLSSMMHWCPRTVSMLGYTASGASIPSMCPGDTSLQRGGTLARVSIGMLHAACCKCNDKGLHGCRLSCPAISPEGCLLDAGGITVLRKCVVALMARGALVVSRKCVVALMARGALVVSRKCVVVLTARGALVVAL